MKRNKINLNKEKFGIDSLLNEKSNVKHKIEFNNQNVKHQIIIINNNNNNNNNNQKIQGIKKKDKIENKKIKPEFKENKTKGIILI